jgi:S1-C subfamily serine protease
MNYIDVVIIILCISAIFRGHEIGLIQQLFSAVGFIGGLFIGAALEPHTVAWAHTPNSRLFITLITTVGSGLLLLLVGEYIGAYFKHKVQHTKHGNGVDQTFGAVISIVTVLVTAWLSAAVVSALPPSSLQTSVKDSLIISDLTRKLPAAPSLVADLGRLIDPNGFPQVFTGNEPSPRSAKQPDLGSFNSAVAKDKASVVKLEGLGCGGVVEGSGFIVTNDLVITNAHVVAGVKKPYVVDSNGQHSATAVWFDPNLDLAVMRVSGLVANPLVIDTGHIDRNTGGVIMGYPGGGGFNAGTAVVLDQFTADGRNIYGNGNTERDVYELSAHIIPGNSGGPLVDEAGDVIGLVFAESTTYKDVGYALSTPQIVSALKQAEAQNRTVGTGSCAE